MTTQLNNFSAFMPGGHLRQTEPINWLQSHPEYARVVEDLDKLIAEADFDTGYYQRLADLTVRCQVKGGDAMFKESDIAKGKHYLRRGEKLGKVRNKLIEPFFHQLVELGYDPKLLRL